MAKVVASFILSMSLAVCATHYPPRIIVPQNATYANLAWGFSDGGHDSVTGETIVLVDIDAVSASDVQTYKNAGHIVQCYFSVGTAETWRTDVKNNKAAWAAIGLGTLPQFQDEFWLDLTKLDTIITLMSPRFNRAKQLGCDALEPDNTDCYDNAECNNPLLKKHPGVNVKALQITYCQWQVDFAHKLGLSISLKNSLEIITNLVDIYDFAVNEQCQQYDECDTYVPFLSSGKAVFNNEYQLGPGNTYCTYAASHHIQTKRCAGSPDNGLCNSGNSWINCFSPLSSLPARTFTVGGTFAPTTPTTPPSTRNPTAYPTKKKKHRRG